MTHIPRLIIHGGAGSALEDPARRGRIRQALMAVIDPVYEMLEAAASAHEAVVEGCRRLEDDPNFNAGTGSAIQSDGQVRMSASLMDGDHQRFSGVINAMRLAHPIELADFLQTERDRVLADTGAALLMRELGVDLHDPVVQRRFRQWVDQREQGFDQPAADVVAQGADVGEQQGGAGQPGHGTIGVVARDQQGRLCAGTSTGGRGFERIGRVSDSATPAGNYADDRCAVSATGIGEDIVDSCLAARICVRVKDGMALKTSLERSIAECDAHAHQLGAVAIDHHGHIGWAKTTDILLAAYRAGGVSADTIDLPAGVIAETAERRNLST